MPKAPLQTGITYYAATIVGNGVGGNVDLTDTCLDISNAITVIWQPRPTVVMTVVNPNACAGVCQTINLQFAGTPPFNLTYSATSLPGQMTQTFTASTGTLTVCPAAGFIGSVLVQAASLTVANCTCP